MAHIKTIHTSAVPSPAGHYSQAVVHGDTVYVAGLLGMFPDKPAYIGTIEEQIEQAMENLQQVLLAANSDLTCLLTVTIFMKDMTAWPTINTVFARHLGDHKPARAALAVSDLPKGFDLELIATAAVKG
jgi:2-iminobutanoate/2-iminopropanoate deaminase